MCVSAAEKPDERRHATYSLVIDKVSLIVRLPTRNDPGKPIIVSVVLQNDGDRTVSYVGEPTSPFDMELCNEDGKPFPAPSSGVDAPESSVFPHTRLCLTDREPSGISA